MAHEVTREDELHAGRSADSGPTGVSSRRLTIAVDLLGGDDAPAVVVDGALRALTVDPELRLLLAGPPEAAGPAVRALPPQQRDRVELRSASTAVRMSDPASRAVSRTTSIRVATAALAAGEVDAVVSAGSSGATVTAAVLELGRLKGVRHPPLAAWLPTARPGHEVLLLDVGGSFDSGPGTLVTHTDLGVAYARVCRGLDRPRVGLLSVGSEPGKGDKARRAAERALQRADGIPMDFAGLVEGDDVLGDRVDVVVTDGFTGNVLLKGIEGAYRLAVTTLQGRAGVSTGDRRDGGAGSARAAALLGVPGVVVVCHGAADAADLASGVAFAARLARWKTDGPPAGDRAHRSAPGRSSSTRSEDRARPEETTQTAQEGNR